MENAFSSRRVILYSTMLGQIVAKSECESFRHGVASRVGFLKNSRDPTVRFEWWRKNKLFQIKARSMVHTGGPGKIVHWLIFCFEVSPLIDQISEKRSLVSSRSFFLALPGAQHP